MQILASSCDVGYYNDGQGLCALCPPAATCVGGAIVGTTAPAAALRCGDPCTTGCVLPFSSVCAGGSCAAALTPPAVGKYSYSGAVCTSTGAGGAVIASFSFEGTQASTGGAAGVGVGTVTSTGALSLSTASGTYFGGASGLQAAGLAAGGTVTFCAPTTGYQGISVSLMVASSVRLSSSDVLAQYACPAWASIGYLPSAFGMVSFGVAGTSAACNSLPSFCFRVLNSNIATTLYLDECGRLSL